MCSNMRKFPLGDVPSTEFVHSLLSLAFILLIFLEKLFRMRSLQKKLFRQIDQRLSLN